MPTEQASIEYDKPQVKESINSSIAGTLTKIIEYEYSARSVSVPGVNRESSLLKTTFLIRNKAGIEEKIKFEGYVGVEVLGQDVSYENKTIETTTFFNPEGRKNTPCFRKGKIEAERICSLIPKNSNLPKYICRQSSLLAIRIFDSLCISSRSQSRV